MWGIIGLIALAVAVGFYFYPGPTRVFIDSAVAKVKSFFASKK
jgi:hypothetical protein